MTICHGCNQPLEPLAQIRTYHRQCDPQMRVEMLERALRAAVHALRSYQYGNSAPALAEQTAAFSETALAYKPAQMKGREG